MAMRRSAEVRERHPEDLTARLKSPGVPPPGGGEPFEASRGA
ncbi:hypothetical protein ABT187_32230 [Streptomyces sp. NPDC001817]